MNTPIIISGKIPVFKKSLNVNPVYPITIVLTGVAIGVRNEQEALMQSVISANFGSIPTPCAIAVSYTHLTKRKKLY